MSKLKKRLRVHRIIAVSFFRDHYNTFPGKHSWLLCGQPVYYWKMKAVVESKYIEKMIVFTENNEAIKMMENMSSKFITVKELVEDCKNPEFRDIDDLKLPSSLIHRHRVNRHQWCRFPGTVIKEMARLLMFEPTIVILTQMNTPLETANDIDRLIESYLENDNWEEVCLGYRLDGGHMFLGNKKGFTPIFFQYGVQRQDQSPIYITCGSRIGRIRDPYRMGGVGIVEIPESHAVDIHTREDLDLAEFYLSRRLEEV